MSLSPVSIASAFFATASVAPIALPSGMRISRKSSVRVEVGKNCCCTKRKPPSETTNISTVTVTTDLRQVRQKSITRRSAR